MALGNKIDLDFTEALFLIVFNSSLILAKSKFCLSVL